MTPADIALEAERRLGLTLGTREADRLLRLAREVESWGARTNLVSEASAAVILSRHVLDSLAAEGVIETQGSVVDLGSGAGFPGLPLAIVWPKLRLTLVEPKSKRAAFLRHVARTLDLSNVTIEEIRGEALGTIEPGGVLIARAVRWETLWKVATEVVSGGAAVVTMEKAGKGRDAPGGFRMVRERTYELEGGRQHCVRRWEHGRFT